MHGRAKHEAMENLETFKQFEKIYNAAEWPEKLSPSFYKKHNTLSLFHSRSTHTTRPLLGPKHTDIPVDFVINHTLIEGCRSPKLSLYITPIELHAFRGNIDAVRQLLDWGANIKYAINGFKAAGHFDNEKNTSKFLRAIESLSFRATIADAAENLEIAPFNVEEQVPKFQL